MAIDVEKMLDHVTNNNYSTSEIETGKKWIDGKPIYRKTIQWSASGNIGGSGTETNILIPHGISNFDKLTSLKMTMFNPVTLESYNFPYSSGSSNVSTYTGVSHVNNSNIKLRIINDTWVSTQIFYFTLEYTKTTD